MPPSTSVRSHPRGRTMAALTALLAMIAGLLSPVVLSSGALADELGAPVAPSGAGAERSYDRDVVIEQGHVDAFYLIPDGNGGVRLALKDDTVQPHATRAPEDVELHVREQARLAIPQPPNFPADLHNREVYYLPLTQNHQLLWPGWESQPLRSTEFNTADIHVTEVEGPGEVFLWTQDSWGSQVVPLLNDGCVSFPGTIHQSYLAHVHAHWAFTEPGDYWLTVEAEAHSSQTGQSVTTNTSEYLFTVGEFLRLPGGLSVGGETDYEADELVELVAALDRDAVRVPSRDPVAPSWSWQVGVDGEWQAVDGQVSEVFAAELAAGTHQLRAVASYGDDGEIASEPVTITVTEAPEPELPTHLIVDGLDNPYAAGATLTLEAKPDVLVDGATYRWETSADGATWTAVDGQSGPVFAGTAEVDGQLIRATVIVDGQDVVTSDPVTIEVVQPDPGPGPDPEPGPGPAPGICWDEVRIDQGHVDAFYFTVDDEGVPFLALKDDTVSPYALRAPEAVELHAKEESLTEFPAVAAVPEVLHHEEAYHLPLTQNHNLLWPGWESQPLRSTSYDTVDIHIHTVDGPGEIVEAFTHGVNVEV